VNRWIAPVGLLLAASVALLTAGLISIERHLPDGHLVAKCEAEIPAGVPSPELPDVEDLCPEPTQPDASVGIIPPQALLAAEAVKGEDAIASTAEDFGSPAVYSNGRIPGSLLCGIPGNGHKLRCDAARPWNAMHKAARQLFGTLVYPCSGSCAYRDIFNQYRVRAQACARGRCYMAAVPGTSNHGLGIAVDLGDGGRDRMRAAIDRIGARFGWSKRCSDASWEPWHIKYNPACTGSTFKSSSRRRAACKGTRIRGKCYPTMRRGRARGHRPAVRLVQRILDRHCLNTPRHGKYVRAVRADVKAFQRRARIRPDGVIGRRTWRALLRHRRHDHTCRAR
jgi:hypothetical protein